MSKQTHDQLLQSYARVYWIFCVSFLVTIIGFSTHEVRAQTTIEFNSTGGTNATNGLHFYIDRSSKIQVRRLNNTGQVYSPTALPQTNPNSLDNGVFIRANGRLYGPSHTVSTFNPSGGMYNTYSISAALPANPAVPGVQQRATNLLGITNGPQVSILWKYTTPFDFLTAEVTLTIPATYPVSASNPVRYYHVFDTYLGGSDSGCGLNVVGTYRIVGTYSSLGGANPCPTSTALPTAGTIVESFRERAPPTPPLGGSTVSTFSSYCAAGWSTFFANGSPYCSVQQLTRPGSTIGALSNTITTTLQDTGIGIAYDFTAPGVYTFSYDFVIGSTVVPDYDHIEIRHDGSATQCPEPVQVLACTSAIVPCPDLNIVNTGTLTGSISFSPTATGTTWTPSTFSLGSTASIANLVLQANAASAGTYTMFASGLSKLPLNGTRCVVNGVAQASCQITIVNTPCVAKFECMETGLAYVETDRTPLYTKLANTGFRFDVLALQASGALANAYTGNVVVELYDKTSAASCSAITPIASQNLTFAAADNGRKTLTADLLLARAYKHVGCRVRENAGASPVTACSSDGFSVRPTNFTTITSSANADAAGNNPTATPIITAGANFSLTANTGVVGYDGTPRVNPALLEWLNVPSVINGGRPAPGTGNLTGEFTLAANSLNGNGATGSEFKYDEVGYFRFKPRGVYDDSFVSSSGSADVANGDCTNDTSNSLVGGKYGCQFANLASTNYFGRFIPHHFLINGAAVVDACTSATAFTYFGQDGFTTNFTMTAQNSTNTTTQNYTNVYAKFIPTIYANYAFTISGAPAGAVLSSSATAPTGTWLSGTLNASAKHQISRPTALANETLIDVLANPSDGEVPASTAVLLGKSLQRYGRLKLQSAYGSEMLDLPVPFFAEYRIADQWRRNSDDSCTPILAPSSGNGLIFYSPETTTNKLSAGETIAMVSATGKLVAGQSQLKFSKPGLGNSGFLDMDIPVSNWLKFPWRGGATAINPTGKVKFGAYKKSNQFIYVREVH